MLWDTKLGLQLTRRPSLGPSACVKVSRAEGGVREFENTSFIAALLNSSFRVGERHLPETAPSTQALGEAGGGAEAAGGQCFLGMPILLLT